MKNFDLDVTESRSGPDLRILDGVAAWCGGLHGSMSLQDALKSLAVGLGSQAAAIARHYHRREDFARAVALYDCETGNPDAPVLLRRALCQDVLGYLSAKSRNTTIWFDCDLADDPAWSPTETLTNWKAVRELKEVVVLVLSTDAQQNDYIEFHFDRDLSRAERLELEALVPTIARSWAGRKQGIVTQASVDDRIVRARSAASSSRLNWDAPILGMSNPAGLTRAEFRVCMLLSRGLSKKGVIDETGLTESTVQSHLRSIYSKTGTTGLAELLYRIMSSGIETTEVAYSSAR